MNEQTLQRLLSRKFLLAMASVLSATALVTFARISDGVYSAVMLATIAAYLTANVAQKREETAKAKSVELAKLKVAAPIVEP